MSQTEQKKLHYIVCHGLNVTSDTMRIFTQDLGIAKDCCSFITLTGHTQATEDKLHTVTGVQWMNEFKDQFEEIKKATSGRDLVYIGYSLGGLLITNYLSKYSKTSLHKIILLAPALSFKFWSRLPDTIFTWAIRKWALPSLTPKSIRANNGVTLAAYRALFDIHRDTQHKRLKTITISTLIICDNYDELVSSSGLKKYIKTNCSSKWHFELLKSHPLRHIGKKHLLVVKQYKPSAYWHKLKSLITDFLNT